MQGNRDRILCWGDGEPPCEAHVAAAVRLMWASYLLALVLAGAFGCAGPRARSGSVQNDAQRKYREFNQLITGAESVAGHAADTLAAAGAEESCDEERGQ